MPSQKKLILYLQPALHACHGLQGGVCAVSNDESEPAPSSTSHRIIGVFHLRSCDLGVSLACTSVLVSATIIASFHYCKACPAPRERKKSGSMDKSDVPLESGSPKTNQNLLVALAPGTPSQAASVRLRPPSPSKSSWERDDKHQLPTTFAGKTILIISGGTRGDVQPATALGVALAGEGARVRLAADESFRAFVTSAGLEFFPLGGDAREMMALTVKWGGMLPTEMSGMFWVRSQIREVMDSVWLAATADEPLATASAAAGAYQPTDGCEGGADSKAVVSPISSRVLGAKRSASGVDCSAAFKPDLIMGNQLAYGAVHVAEKLGVPFHVLLTIPWIPTRHFPHPWARAFDKNITDWAMAAAEALLRPVCGLVGWVKPAWSARLRARVLSGVAAATNKFSTPLLDWTAWLGIADLITCFRHKLGLPLLSSNNTGTALYRYPTTCLFSHQLVPKPDDWPSHVTLSGFLSLTEALDRYTTPDNIDSTNSTNSTSSTSITTNSTSTSTSISTSGTSNDCSELRSTPQQATSKATVDLLSAAGNGAQRHCQAGSKSCTLVPSCPKPHDALLLPLEGYLQLLASVHDRANEASSTATSSRSRPSSESSYSNSSRTTGSHHSSGAGGSSCSSGGAYQPPADLQAFLAAGPPPIYIGFGSMVVADPQHLVLQILQAGQLLQDSSSQPVRLLVCTGWAGGMNAQSASTGAAAAATPMAAATAAHTAKELQAQQEGTQQGLQPGDVPSEVGPSSAALSEADGPTVRSSAAAPEVFFTIEVPHDYVFPRCRALVHHGGVGTTAVGLRCGKPTLVIAAFGDLFFWGEMCHTLGVGPPMLSLPELTVRGLFTALQQLVDGPTYQAYLSAAEVVAARLREEDSLSEALLSVQQVLLDDGDQ